MHTQSNTTNITICLRGSICSRWRHLRSKSRVKTLFSYSNVLYHDKGHGYPRYFQSALYLREKYRLDCIFCPMAFDLWLCLFLHFGISWEILLYSGKIMICPKNFCNFREKYDISGKFFGTSGKYLPFSGKNVICPENFMVCQETFLRWSPVAKISGKKFLGALFHSKSAPRSLVAPPPPTCRCFLRHWK